MCEAPVRVQCIPTSTSRSLACLPALCCVRRVHAGAYPCMSCMCVTTMSVRMYEALALQYHRDDICMGNRGQDPALARDVWSSRVSFLPSLRSCPRVHMHASDVRSHRRHASRDHMHVQTGCMRPTQRIAMPGFIHAEDCVHMLDRHMGNVACLCARGAHAACRDVCMILACTCKHVS